MYYQITHLKSKAVDKCYNSPTPEHMGIMMEFIEKAFHEGRKQGHKEMSIVAKERLSDIIPEYID